MDIVRVFTGPDGRSHFDDEQVELQDLRAMGRISAPIAATAVQFREVDGDYLLDFHVAPRRQYVVNLTGSVEIEVGSGERRVLGPGTTLLAEDTTGQGHVSRNVGGEPRTCLFIHLAESSTDSTGSTDAVRSNGSGPATFTMTPIGSVRGGRSEATDDDWGSVEADIELDATRFSADVLAGLDEFSHLEVVYVFDRVDESSVNLGARHPRNNTDWPKVGIFAQRAKARPNRIGVTVCEIVAVDGLRVRVRGLDAIDNTPVLDLKPYLREFAPRTTTRQPAWSSELMSGYWTRS